METHVPLTAAQAEDLLVRIGEEFHPDLVYGLITTGARGGRHLVSLCVVGPHGPERFWIGVGWAEP